MLKRYMSAETGKSKKSMLPHSEDLDTQLTHATILEPVEDLNLGTWNPLQKETIKDVKISSNLMERRQEEVRAILKQYEDIFTDVPSVINAGEHTIKLTTAEPITGKAYPLPLALRETLEWEIDSMLAMNVIKEPSMAYASSVDMVKKLDGSTQVCVDYRKLNNVTIFDPEPMPTAEEIFGETCRSIDSSWNLTLAKAIGSSRYEKKIVT